MLHFNITFCCLLVCIRIVVQPGNSYDVKWEMIGWLIDQDVGGSRWWVFKCTQSFVFRAQNTLGYVNIILYFHGIINWLRAPFFKFCQKLDDLTEKNVQNVKFVFLFCLQTLHICVSTINIPWFAPKISAERPVCFYVLSVFRCFSQNCEKRLLASFLSVCPSVRPSA